MFKNLSSLALVLALIVSLPSCVSKKKFLQLESEKAAVMQSLSDANTSIKNLETEKEELMASCTEEKATKDAQISALETELGVSKGEISSIQMMVSNKDKELTGLKDEIKAAFSSVRSSGFPVESRNGRLYIRTSRPINYKSGSSRLNKEDRAMLDDMANTLKQVPSLQILVEGHTDNAQMVEGAAYRDNWDLSYARARKVVDYMLKQEVAPNQVSIVGRGEHVPAVAENPNSKETRDANRRIEFIIIANAADLYKIQ